MSLEFLREKGSDIISIFIIDRVACGMAYEIIRGEFEHNFHMPLTKDKFGEYVAKYESEIHARYDELRESIYNSGTYHKLLDISNTLYDIIKDNVGSPKEISTLAATLRGYLESMSKLGSQKHTTNIAHQNNFVVLQTLERDGLIDIKDHNKLKYLVDGVSSDDSNE